MYDVQDCIMFTASNRARAITEALNERLSEHGSTRVQLNALFFVASTPGINQSHLSQLMCIKSSTVVRLIDRMVREGLISKQQLDSDRRHSSLTCTDKGLQLLEQVMPVVRQFNQSLEQGISKEDLIIFDRVYDQIVEQARKFQTISC
ncbi:MAG: MarR family transcriptional regulator [Spirochaetia bacterium]|nr:MarR family transcriptional regulator [Spirochaetia bacterium]